MDVLRLSDAHTTFLNTMQVIYSVWIYSSCRIQCCALLHQVVSGLDLANPCMIDMVADAQSCGNNGQQIALVRLRCSQVHNV